LPAAPALLSAFEDVARGRRFEVMIGNMLLEKFKHVQYWREGDKEVDFIIKHKNQIIAIEVKSGRKKDYRGLEDFSKKFKCKSVFINEDNFQDIDDLI
jgi:predicted AAA+ superfamily ATPase